MISSFIIAILAGFGGMLGWGFADFFAKKTIDQIGDVVSLFWAHVCGVIVLLIAFCISLFFGRTFTLPSNSYTWFILAVFGAGQAAVYLFAYRGFGKGQLAILNPIFASFPGITAILSIVLLGEKLGMPLLASLSIIFLGIITLNIDVSSFKKRRIQFLKTQGFKEIIVATLLASIWTLYWSKFVESHDWFVFACIMYLFMTAVVYIFAKIQKINLQFSQKSTIKYLFLIGFFEVLAYVSVSLGYSLTSKTSVVALISGAFSLPTIILARIYLKEKVTKTQTIGSIIIILGIILLSLI